MYFSSQQNHGKIAVNMGWTLSLGFMAVDAFFPFKFEALYSKHFYAALHREAWAASICWIVYACHHLKSGGIIRSFLSKLFWKPFSKICLSVYLTHYVYLFLTHFNQKDFVWFNAGWQFQIYIGDVFISFVLGLIFYLVVEAPTVNILAYFKKSSKPGDKRLEKRLI